VRECASTIRVGFITETAIHLDVRNIPANASALTSKRRAWEIRNGTRH
jgi:hypothetical protein